MTDYFTLTDIKNIYDLQIEKRKLQRLFKLYGVRFITSNFGNLYYLPDCKNAISLAKEHSVKIYKHQQLGELKL